VQLVLIRHGESVANSQRILQGHLDSPLNETGRRQAQSLADVLAEDRFAQVFASDLLRARETAEILCSRLGAPLEVDPDRREIGIGCFTGLSWTQISERYPEEYQRLIASSMDWSVVPEAEGEAAAQARLERVLTRIRENHADARVAIVAHGAILRRMIRKLLRLDAGVHLDFELANASCTELHLTPKGPRLIYLNRLPYEAMPVRVGDAPRLLF
jgi:probable phosphoglycerate mutase